MTVCPYPSESTRSFRLLWADTFAESKDPRDQSIRSASPRRSRIARCSPSHIPASCQSRMRRQHAGPEPQPISLGSISQGMGFPR